MTLWHMLPCPSLDNISNRIVRDAIAVGYGTECVPFTPHLANMGDVDFGQFRIPLTLSLIPTRARSALPALRDFVTGVVCWCPQKQMIDPNTERRIAAMADIHSARNLPVMDFPREPMSANTAVRFSARINIERAVAAVHGPARPQPAFSALVNEPPESFLWRGGLGRVPATPTAELPRSIHIRRECLAAVIARGLYSPTDRSSVACNRTEAPRRCHEREELGTALFTGVGDTATLSGHGDQSSPCRAGGVTSAARRFAALILPFTSQNRPSAALIDGVL